MNNNTANNTDNGIEMRRLSQGPDIDLDQDQNIITIKRPKAILGFTETIKPSKQKPKQAPIQMNKNKCQTIYMNGSNINKKHFFPSEFPKLTKIKPVALSKKGGRKHRRKHTRRKHSC